MLKKIEITILGLIFLLTVAFAMGMSFQYSFGECEKCEVQEK